MEEKRTVEMLEDEIRTLLKELKDLAPDSEQYAAVSARMKEQYELLLKHESMEKSERRERLSTIANVGLGALKFAGTLAFFGYNYSRGWKFEETGTICSNTHKSVMQDSRKMLKF